MVLREAQKAKVDNIGMNVDAEEQCRLFLPLKVLAAALCDLSLAGWNGFGVVVQAYCNRAGLALDRLYTLAQSLDRRVMLGLVKGAYWDS